MDQKQREVLMKEFSSSSLRILIITDLLVRGIDVPFVINYDFPGCARDYIRRIGRGDRSERKGVAISFVTTNDIKMLGDIERKCGQCALMVEVETDCIRTPSYRTFQHPIRRDVIERRVSNLRIFG